MELLLKSRNDRTLMVALVVLWAFLFLPSLRTNPGWYSDEGEVLTMSWTTAHFSPQVGPVRHDFLYPHPYPPLYLFLNGMALRLFGNDILVARVLQAILALVTCVVLVWVGTRLRNRTFGWLCAAAFLVYPETVMNFRWVRPHPMAGLLALITIGFLIRYLQGKCWRDVLWAGVFASLTTATHYYGYPLLGLVVLTALVVNWRHSPWAVMGAALFPVVFLVWYALSQPGGLETLRAHIELAGQMGAKPTETFVAQLSRIYRNIVSFCLTTPTLGPNRSWVGVDLWLVTASAGVLVFPVTRFRKWLVVWLLALMFLVFKQQDNLSIFTYPSAIFLPLLAVGCAGALDQLGLVLAQHIPQARWGPVILLLGVLGLMSLGGSLNQFRTKVDPWTVKFPKQAEAAARFVNNQTSANDLVIVSKTISWLITPARTASLAHVLAFEGRRTDMYQGPVSRDLFWAECDWRTAKYCILASGISEDQQQGYGFDLIYMRGLEGVSATLSSMIKEGWQVVYGTGSRVAYLPVGDSVSWPVAVDGEYLVLANPRLISSDE